MTEDQLSEQSILRIHWMSLALRLPQGGVESVFHSNDQCKDRMMAVRWPDGLNCPKCSSIDIAPESARKIFRCRKCQYHLSATAGTFAHGAHKELLRYFLASEDIINCHAEGRGDAMLTGHGFKDRHGLAYATAHRLLEALTKELLQDGGGLIGDCICLKPRMPLPDIVPQSVDHFNWLHRQMPKYPA